MRNPYLSPIDKLPEPPESGQAAGEGTHTPTNESDFQAAQGQLRALEKQAQEIDDMAAHLRTEAAGEMSQEVQHAKTEADQIRGVIAEVSSEINAVRSSKDSAQTAKRIATKLGEAAKHAIAEKAAVAEATQQAETTHSVKAATHAAKQAAAEKSASSPLQVVRAVPVALVPLPAGLHFHPHHHHGMLEQAESFASAQVERVAHHPWVVSTREATAQAVAEAKEFASNPKAFVKEAAQHVREKVSHSTEVAVAWVKEKTPEMVKEKLAQVSNKIDATKEKMHQRAEHLLAWAEENRQATAEKIAHAKAKMAEKIAVAKAFLGKLSPFGGHEVELVEKKESPTSDTLAKVTHQVATCGLLKKLACASVPHDHEITAQDFPHIATHFSEVAT